MGDRSSTVPPVNWGCDSLTEFIEVERENQFASFVNNAETKRLIKIDGLFSRFLIDWLNPKPRTAAFFLYRCHSSFRAASSLTLATRCTEAFPLMRLSLEWASYAAAISADKQLERLWFDRENSETSKKQLRNKLTTSRAIEAIKDPHDRKVFDTLYRRSLDFGGHPFVHSAAMNWTTEDVPGGGMRLNTAYTTADGQALDWTMQSLLQVGICCLSVFGDIFPGRSELLNVRNDLITLRRGL